MRRSGASLLTAMALVPLLSACAGGTFRTYYDWPGAAEVSKSWHVVDVKVAVPAKLTVSEEHSLVPKADIVWQEDPNGDRRRQVSTIVKRGIELGSADLHGPRPVRLEATLTRFHAMTLEAETINADVGVHDIGFVLQAVDARTGTVLVGPTPVQADFPAMTGTRMIEARIHGESQKSQIVRHLQEVISGWLGTGPDPRKTFIRFGG